MKLFILGGLLLIGLTVHAQDYGIFRFMDIPGNARLTGMGGYLVSQPGMDVNLGASNPGLALDTLNGMGSFSYLSYFAGSNQVMMSYQDNVGGTGPWFISAVRMGYGSFDGYDPGGQFTGEESAAESAIMIGRSHRVGNFSMGATVKFVSSSIAGYSANGLMLDLGGVFIHPDKELSAGLVFRNIGFILNDYDDGSSSEMPFDIRAGVTFKPEFMPLRFSFTAYNLSNWNEDISGEGDTGTADEIFRHLNIGAEVLISRNVNVLLGYNHLIRQGLKLEEAGGMAGISFGLLFRVKAFEFAYSRGGYHAAGGSHNFTIAVNTDRVLGNIRN